MSINLDKVIQSLMQLISLAGVEFTGDDESLLLDALTRYHNDHSIVKSRKKADEILLADFLLALSEDANESDTLRQAARDLYARQNAKGRYVKEGVYTFEFDKLEDGVATYKATILPNTTGAYQIAGRSFAKSDKLPHRQDFELVKWL